MVLSIQIWRFKIDLEIWTAIYKFQLQTKPNINMKDSMMTEAIMWALGPGLLIQNQKKKIYITTRHLAVRRMKNILPPPISLFIVKKNQRILPSCERQFGLLDDVRPNQVDNFKWKPAWPLCFFFSFFIFFSRWIIVKLPLVIFSNTSKRPKYVKPKFVQDHWNNLHRSSQPFLFLTINSKNEKAYFDFDSLFLLPQLKKLLQPVSQVK